MKTVEKETLIEFIEKKSKFIGYIKPIKSVKEAEDFIEKIKKENKEATHNVFAYRLNINNVEILKYSDDGEPSNTAGKPMAEIITRLGVINLVIVSSRYFGGIKLGAGGLIRNYAKCAKLAILESNIIEYIERKIYLIEYFYDKQENIDMILNKNNIEIVERIYSQSIFAKLNLSKEELNIIEKIPEINIIKI